MAATRTDLLKSVPLFAELDKKELEQLSKSLRERTFRAGETVATEGESGVGFFVIEDGQALVSVGGEERRHLGPGDHFGEIALLADSKRTATIVAETELRCLGMTFWDFRPLVEHNGKIAWKMLHALANRLREVEQRAGA